MPVKLINYVQASLTQGASPADTILELDTELPPLSPGEYYYLTATVGNMFEVLRVVSVSGMSVQVERGTDGSSAILLPVATVLRSTLNAQAIVDAINDLSINTPTTFPLTVKGNDLLVASNATGLNFIGTSILVSQKPGGEVDIVLRCAEGSCGGIPSVEDGGPTSPPTQVTGNSLIVLDEGVVATLAAKSINFIGDGVTTSADVNGNVTVNVPGGSGGGDPGGIGGDPLGAAQFPIGTYAYSDVGTLTPSNVLEVNTPLILSVLNYPELGQVATVRSEFTRGISSDVEGNPYTDGSSYGYVSVYRNKHYIVLFRDTTNNYKLAVWKVVNRQFVFQTTIPLLDPPRVGDQPHSLEYNGQYLTVGYPGYVKVPSGPGEYAARVVIYEGQDATWALKGIVNDPTPFDDYRNFRANTNVGFSPADLFIFFGRTVAQHAGFFVVGTSSVYNEVSPGVFTIGRAYAFDYNGNLLSTIISPRTNIASGDGVFAIYYGTFGETIRAWGSTGVVFGTLSPPNYLSAGGVGHGAIFYSYDNPVTQATPSRVLDMNDYGAAGNLNNYSQRRGLGSYYETAAAGNFLFAGAPDQLAGQRSDVGAVIIVNLSTGALLQTLLSPSVNSDSFGRVVDAQDDVVAVRASFTRVAYAFRFNGVQYVLAADFGRFTPPESFPDEFYIWGDTDTVISETDFNLFSAYLAPKLNNEIASVPLPASPGKKTILRVR